jgi:hypothetical protein
MHPLGDGIMPMTALDWEANNIDTNPPGDPSHQTPAVPAFRLSPDIRRVSSHASCLGRSQYRRRRAMKRIDHAAG